MNKRLQPFTQGVGSPLKRSKKAIRMGPKVLNAMVKKAIGRVAEAKEVLTAFQFTLNATQTDVQLLNGISEGTDYTNRVGRSVTHKYIEVSIGIITEFNGGATGVQIPGDYGFWSIVYDRQPNGGLAAFSDIFDASNGLAHRVTSKNQDRFKIVAREEWSVGGNFIPVAAATGSSGSQPYHMRRYIDLSKVSGNDARTKFQSTSNTIADIDEGAFLFVAASTLSTTTQNAVVNCNIKYRFTDM